MECCIVLSDSATSVACTLALCHMYRSWMAACCWAEKASVPVRCMYSKYVGVRSDFQTFRQAVVRCRKRFTRTTGCASTMTVRNAVVVWGSDTRGHDGGPLLVVW